MQRPTGFCGRCLYAQDFSRLAMEEKVSYDEMQTLFTRHLPADTELFNEYHALIVALGKDICRARNRSVLIVP